MKNVTPVDKYELRNKILHIPSVWVCGQGMCIPIKELNKVIDDMKTLDKETLVDYIFKAAKTEQYDPLLDEDLNKLLKYDDVREYVGMKPLGFEEYLEV